MKNITIRIYQKFFHPDLDFRVKLFNVLAVAGIFAGSITGIINAINGGSFLFIAAGIGVAALAFILLVYATLSGRYKITSLITIVAIFFIYFPILFFQMGGYHGGKISFFIFAIICTAFMLEPKLAGSIIALELILYTGLCIYAYQFPESVSHFSSERGYLISNIGDMILAGGILSIILMIHLRMYNQQQRKLNEQNAVLAKANRAKTDFLANTSHEMRMPLTVISVNMQTVMGILEDMGDTVKDPEATELLVDAQSEIMRLSRIVGSMLTLTTISESTERRKVDFTAILYSTADTLLLVLQKHGNKLETEINDDLTVFGDTDLLSQTIINLIQNANTHTKNDIIRLRAIRDSAEITVSVSDNGSGILPELLPRVFERGVSDSGGTGVGLFLCKSVVESHGGKIWLESELNKGTTVYFTLPVYEGQYGGDEI
jgi:signal transduction histidine kinase